MKTKIAFLVPDKTLIQGIGYEFDGNDLTGLCAQYDREPIIIAPSCALEDDLQAILDCGADQAVIEFRNPIVEEPYQLALAHRLMDVGIDVMILVSGRAQFDRGLYRVEATFPTIHDVDLKVMARAVGKFIESGNRFLDANPFHEMIKKQREAHEAAIIALTASLERFEHRRYLAARRREKNETVG